MLIHQTAPLLLVRAIALALGIISFPLMAADYTWVGESGDWDVADNWDPNGVPQGWGDVASILSNDALTRIISYNPAEPSYLDALTLDATGIGKLELMLWDSYLDVAEFLVGSHGHATTVQAGTHVSSSNLVVGRHAGSEGSYQLTGGHLWTEDLRLGEMAGSQGSFVWTGGSLDIVRLHVGHGGNGTFVQDIGVGYNLSLMPHQQIVIGVEAGSEGVFEQRSGDIHSGYWLPEDDAMPIIVGEAGHGTYRHLDGQHYAPTLMIGHQSGSEGRYELTGEQAMLSAERTVVGDAGTGQFMQAAGEHGAWELVIGRAAGSTGEYQLSGGYLWAGEIRIGEMADSQGSFVWTGGALGFERLHVGQGGTGSFIQDIGGGNRWELRPHLQIVIGVEAGSEGLFEQRSGDIYRWNYLYEDYAPLIVGAAGKGTYRHVQGHNHVQEVLIGHLAGGEGTYELAGKGANESEGQDDPWMIPEDDHLWLYSERLVVGDSGTGRFMHRAGHNDAREILVGRAAGSVGEYQLSGGYLWAENIRIGEMADSQGSFVWTGGTLDFERLHVGQGGSGSFIQDNGGGNRWELRPYQQIVIGVEAGSEGLFEQRSGNIGIGWYMPPEGYAPLIVGAAGKGTYRHIEGENRAQEVLIGHLAGGEGTYELAGKGANESEGQDDPWMIPEDDHLWLYSERLVVGDSGTGRFMHRAGHNDAREILVGRAAGSAGEYQLSGGYLWAEDIRIGEMADSQGSFVWTGGTLDFARLHVGQGGSGTFVQDIGWGNNWELWPHQQIVIGVEVGSEGLFEHRSGNIGIGWYMPPEGYAPLIVGAAGKGTYRHVEGENHAHEVLIGHLAGSQGTYELVGEVDGGVSHARLYSERLVVGDAGVGHLVHQAGNVDAEEVLIGRLAGSEGRYELAGEQAMLHAGRTVVGDAGTGRFVQTSGMHDSGQLVVGQAGGSDGTYELSGGYLFTGTTHIGAADGATGTMIVTGPATQWINHGTVHVGTELFGISPLGAAMLELHDRAMISADTLVVGETGTVQGDGQIQGDVINDGLLSPGLGIGQLDIIGDYTQLGGGTLAIEIGGHGLGQDFLAVFGGATLGGSLSVSLLDGYSIGLGDSFDILFASMILGGFDTLLFPTFNGMTFDIAYDPDIVRLTAVSAVPVPAALWLLGSGVLLLLGVARRRSVV